MNFSYTPTNDPTPRNTLEIIMSEAETDNNDRDKWGVNFPYQPENTDTRDKCEKYLRGFFAIKDVINKSREGYGDTYDSVDFEHLEEQDHSIDKIEIDHSDEIINFSCGQDSFIYDFSLDDSMPQDDGRYFAGIKFIKAFYYTHSARKIPGR